MHSVATIGLGLLLAASAFLVTWGVLAILRKRPRSVQAVVLGLALFVAYFLLVGFAAALFSAADRAGATLDTRDKARLLGEGISTLMNTTVFGAPLGVLAAVVVFLRKGRALPRS